MKNLLILLVDPDNKQGLKMKKHLEKFDNKVYLINTEEETYHYLSNHHVDLLLLTTEIKMGLSSFQVARKILQEQSIPIIFVLSSPDDPYLKELESITAYGYIDKSCSASMISASIRSAVKLFKEKQLSDEKMLEIKIKENQFRTVFETMGDEIHLWEVIRNDLGKIENWRLVDINQTGLESWKMSREEVLGKTTDEIFKTADPIKDFLPIVEQLFNEKRRISWCKYFEGTQQHLLMTSVAFGNYFVSTGRDITDLKKTEAALNDAIREKELLLKEVHHRIKNNMNTVISILQLQAAQESNSNVTEAFDSAIKRINSMMILYDQLYRNNNVHSMSVKKYLTNLVKNISETYDYDLLINEYYDDIEVTIQIIFPMGIIVNELFSNTLKHAFSPDQSEKKISISFKVKNNEATLLFQDNGRGKVSQKKPVGFGMQLIEALVQQLKGDMDIKKENGMKIIVKFPLH